MAIDTTPFDLEADEDGNPIPAGPPPEEDPEPPAAARPPPKRRGRPPGRRNNPPAAVAAVAPAPQPGAPPPTSGVEPEFIEDAKDPSSLWTRLCNSTRERGGNIDDVRIIVVRTHMNLAPIQFQALQPELSGGQVSGDVHLNKTPGEQLVDAIIDVHHRNCAPATYHVRFMSRSTGKTLKQSAALSLEAWPEIQRKRDEASAREAARFGTQPQAYRSLSPAIALTPAATQHLDPLTKQLLDTLLGQLNETRAELASLRGQPQPAPVTIPGTAVVAPPPVDPDEAFLRKLEMMKRLSALLSPPTDIGAQVRQAIVQLQEAGVIPKVATVAPSAVQQPGGHPPGSIEGIIESERQKREVLRRIKQAFPDDLVSKEEMEAARNVQDNPPPVPSQIIPGSQFMGEPLKWIPFPADTNEISWKEWVLRMGAENPRRSGEFIEKAMRALAGNEGLLSKLMDAIKGVGDAAAIDTPASAVVETPAATGGGWNPVT